MASVPEILDIRPAKLLSSEVRLVPGKLQVTDLTFEVPLDYKNASAGTIQLYAQRLAKYERPLVPASDDSADEETEARTKSIEQRPYMVYLEGGPGFGNAAPQDHAVAKAAIARGYQALFIDYRGTGLSTPVSAAMLAKVAGDVDAQVKYLQLMRQDNSVRDCEAVRKCLTEGWPAHKTAWSIFGQSYGGFVSLSYLSMHPEGLRESFMTGGLAGVGKTADQVYGATFRKTKERNQEYFTKFPEDIDILRQVIAYIEAQDGGRVNLPGGGYLTVQRLMTVGISFGGHGGFQAVHRLLRTFKMSLNQFGFLTRASLHQLESFLPLDMAIIYAILHEAIYCDGAIGPSNWAAERVGRAAGEHFAWLTPGHKVSASSAVPFFSGEMIFPFHFETYPELVPLKEVAQILATANNWSPLYNQERLRNNTVPVYAVSYVEDMYVEYNLASETARLVKGTKVYANNIMYHNALRPKGDEVTEQLFSLRDDVLD